ncbi:gliding motility-associated C-terminal domain-containing protein [Maribacter halichondriae]|uniref:gliding motility-associated C-terminal domain-containing protein n=1 Tax=Maribacter halichondriae TaxID=2980554 RepID=UPI002358F19F|nr:gliding motility-associated C-terminal domain-containing protein [Maribacter sp. Hal144]
MKRLLYILCSVVGLISHAQTALYNSGNLRIHENGQMGFHTDLTNDGVFDENLGLVGFYGNSISVSGAFAPTFFDVEFAATGSTLLNSSVNVTNNANFISGNVATFRNTSDVSLQFLENGFYTGESDPNKVDGYVSVSGRPNFTFPVGDANQLRPLIMQSSGAGTLAKCAYFFEDPNNPQSLDDAFSTGRTAPNVGVVSPFEFWRLESDVPTTISISWNERSNISGLTDDVNTIAIVGFSKSLNQWVGLGSTSRAGDLVQGFITSAQFVPDDYDAITFSGSGAPDVLLELDNYLVSANGDGINDFLEIPELEQSPNNELFIYDRFGMKVFEQTNYTNEFSGFANTGDFVFQREKGLPSGVYYYVVSMKDMGLDFQGFFYLTR